MAVLQIIDFMLPLTNPVLKFLIILLIILLTPILLNRIKIPSILGLIIAGAVIGPYGFNLMERDSGIILSGTAGLLYIMFLAGLEVDLSEFKKNRKKSIVFGLLTFSIPMLLGILGSLYVFNFPLDTSVLLASMFASHTLIAYPIIRKLGITRNIAVNITVGGTIITDTLALLVLAIIVGMNQGEIGFQFWLRLSISILIFGFIVIFIFPIIGRWFFKKIEDSVSQYIFVLAMVFLGAFLAEVAGIEGIIGAFLTGLALNRLIPHTSALMNRVEFVGNAIFIPFFLIGIGMLINYELFFRDFETLKVGAGMIIIATTSKFAAAWLTRKSFRLSADEGRVIFGLSNAQAAATLAAVLIGYNIITGVSETGEPIRLLNENVLNGTILMILFTCTMATFTATKGARNIALAEAGDVLENDNGLEERILIPLKNRDNVEELIAFAILLKSNSTREGLFALNIVDTKFGNKQKELKAKAILNQAAMVASSTDDVLHQILRYDHNLSNGIASTIKENQISDLVLGLHIKQQISDSFLGNLTEKVLKTCNVNTFIYKSFQPLNTIKRHFIIIPYNIENEISFPLWISKVWNMGKKSGSNMVFYASSETIQVLQKINSGHPIEAEFRQFHSEESINEIGEIIQADDNLIFILSRIEKPFYMEYMVKVPFYLNSLFSKRNFILIYPFQDEFLHSENTNLINASLLEPVEKLDEIAQKILKIFRRSN